MIDIVVVEFLVCFFRICIYDEDEMKKKTVCTVIFFSTFFF